MGHELGHRAVELVEGGGGIEHPPRSRCRQGPRHHLLGVAVGKGGKGLGIALDVAHVQELRGHGAGAHGGDGDALSLELKGQAPGEARDIGLGAAVHRHVGVGAEGGDGADVDDPAAGGHVGDGEMGHRRQGGDVQIRHGSLPGQISLAHIAQITAAGVVDEDRHPGLFRRQLFRQDGEAPFVAEIQRQDDALHALQLPGQGLQTLPAAGDEPYLLHLGEVVPQPQGELLAQTGGGAGNDRDGHDAVPSFL